MVRTKFYELKWTQEFSEKKQLLATSGIIPCPELTLKNCSLRLHFLPSPPTNSSSPGIQSHLNINPNELSLRRLKKGHMTHSKTENNKK